MNKNTNKQKYIATLSTHVLGLVSQFYGISMSDYTELTFSLLYSILHNQLSADLFYTLNSWSIKFCLKL